MAHLPKSGPRDGNDRSIEMADSQVISNLVKHKKISIDNCISFIVEKYM